MPNLHSVAVTRKARWDLKSPVNYTVFCDWLSDTCLGLPCLIHLPIRSHLKVQTFPEPSLPRTESTIHSRIFSPVISDGPGTPECWVSLCFRVTVRKLTAGREADLHVPTLTRVLRPWAHVLRLKHGKFRNF